MSVPLASLEDGQRGVMELGRTSAAPDGADPRRSETSEPRRTQASEQASDHARPGSADGDGMVGALIAGKYRVLRAIGSGSTGAVYQCQHVGLDKLVALKILHREMEQDSSFVEQFRREAQAASRLEHPNSVRVLDFGQDHPEQGGAFYIVMEYIEGRDLLVALEEDGPFSAERAVDVMSQILDALAVAHSLGIVHRDLKPENIVVRTVEVDGVQKELVTVCDFGIAQLSPTRLSGQSASELVNVADAGMVVGTPAYMSPEQARAEPQDARSDIYSAGVVLFQLLTLQVPFSAESPLAVAVMHCSDLPPLPSQFGAVSPALEDVCLKALSKTKEARYQSAREMKIALQRALQATPRPSNRRLTPRRWGGTPLRSDLSSRATLLVPAPRAHGEAGLNSLLPAELPKPSEPPSDRARVRLSLPLLGVVMVLLGTAAVPIFRSVGGVTGFGNTSRTMLGRGLEAADAPAARVVQPATQGEPSLDNREVATRPQATPAARGRDNDRSGHARTAKPTSSDKRAAKRVGARSSSSSSAASPGSEPAPDAQEARPDQHEQAQHDDSVDTQLPRAPRGEPANAEVAVATLDTQAQPAQGSPAVLPPTAANVAASQDASERPQLAAAASAESSERLPAIPERAHVTISSIAARAAVSRASVRGALNLEAITDCYRAGLRSGGAPARRLDANLVLTTNMLGGVASAVLTAPALSDGPRRCIEQVVRRGRVREVDTGAAQANVALRFEPR
jgi:serine/threonine protein kinase